MKRNIAIGIGAAVLFLLVWQLWSHFSTARDEAGQQRAVRPVAVEVVPVRRADMRDVATFTGTLLPTARFEVAPKIAGRLEKMLVNIGDAVAPGQLVAVLDDEEYRQQVSQARAELEVARASLEEAITTLESSRREFERTVALHRQRIASESQLDAAESEYNALQARMRVAAAQVAQREATLRLAEVRLAYTRIHVPESNGVQRVVGERFVDEGALLSANTPIVSVLDIRRLNAVVYVIERDYALMAPDLTAAVTTDAFPDRTFPGRVVRIAPLLKETSRQARVEIEVPNPAMELKPGMFVRAHIEFAKHPDATVVPVSALVTRGGQRGVFLADRESDTARFVPVTVGITEGDLAQVVAPPLEGEVVTLGVHLVVDGAAISIPEGRTDAAATERP